MHECGETDTADGVKDHMIDAKNSILKGNHYVDISYPPASGRGAGAGCVCGATRWGEPGGVGQRRHPDLRRFRRAVASGAEPVCTAIRGAAFLRSGVDSGENQSGPAWFLQC
ncbi:hypothetical protein Dda3937_04466 [Dickeya dadantii 3937]|uniref:Uncharacterized protein n=1 Tax=Dickeya dadantii (strain 3937) TaxID=198628 RepID=E0SLU5_DICD3|nr:hypothetical protein Dda3937_04466 [Dickeya dadantii 3937]